MDSTRQKKIAVLCNCERACTGDSEAGTQLARVIRPLVCNESLPEWPMTYTYMRCAVSPHFFKHGLSFNIGIAIESFSSGRFKIRSVFVSSSPFLKVLFEQTQPWGPPNVAQLYLHRRTCRNTRQILAFFGPLDLDDQYTSRGTLYWFWLCKSFSPTSTTKNLANVDIFQAAAEVTYQLLELAQPVSAGSAFVVATI
jgi:hypothetical protein